MCRYKYVILFLFAASVRQQSAYADSTEWYITVHFQYGSKPAKGFKKYESKWFGGLHGGHVTLAIGDSVYGFVPYNGFHIFSHRKNIKSIFTCESVAYWIKDTASEQYLSVVLLLDSLHYIRLLKLQRQYLKQSPYDYAFFGMRCAAATYDLLCNGAGVCKQRKRSSIVMRYFYPKLLRKKLLKMSRETKTGVSFHPGRASRRWEND